MLANGLLAPDVSARDQYRLELGRFGICWRHESILIVRF
jgi:hypothetical protein